MIMLLHRGSRIETLFTKVTMAFNKKNTSLLITRPVEKKNESHLFWGSIWHLSNAL